MTIIAVEVYHLIHTCPANPEPHPVDTRRRIAHTTPGGSCRTPATIRSGDTVVTIPCGRTEPYERQCPACRTTIRVLKVTSRDLGYQGPTGCPPAPTGYANHPCRVCGEPLAAAIADNGRHILCRPGTRDAA
jgi:hypothetical protein